MTTTSSGEPASSPNVIVARQNDPPLLALLRAKSAAYDAARVLAAAQFGCLVVLPVCLAVAQKFFIADAAWVAGAVGLVLVGLDLFLLEPVQKRRKNLGARFQERFDCTLYGIQWRADRIGPLPSPEDLHVWSGRHSSDEGLRDWYSPELGPLPRLAAVIACQRTNGRWNSAMRTRYVRAIWVVMVLSVVGVFALSLWTDIQLRTLIAAIGLSVPLLRWTIKEVTQQNEAGTASQRVVERADRLWRAVLVGGATSQELEQSIRELQNDIFDQRRRDPMVWAWVYERWRDADETTMHAAAGAMAVEYRRSNAF